MAGTSTHGFVIIAEFEVKPDSLEQFLELARTDASHSVEREPGCRQFDITLDREQPNRVVLYEIYDDEAAFDRFCERIDLRPFAPRIKAPYMVIAGENDQLSPIEHTEELFALISAPKRLVIYEGANHAFNNDTSQARYSPEPLGGRSIGCWTRAPSPSSTHSSMGSAARSGRHGHPGSTSIVGSTPRPTARVGRSASSVAIWCSPSACPSWPG